MKKILLLLVAMFAFIGNINAQVWDMVVTHSDVRTSHQSIRCKERYFPIA